MKGSWPRSQTELKAANSDTWANRNIPGMKNRQVLVTLSGSFFRIIKFLPDSFARWNLTLNRCEAA